MINGRSHLLDMVKKALDNVYIVFNFILENRSIGFPINEFVFRKTNMARKPNECDIFRSSGEKMEIDLDSLDTSSSGNVFKNRL